MRNGGRNDLADGGVVEVDPQLQFGVKEESRVMFAVVRDDAHQAVRRQLRPAAVDDILEDVVQFEAGADGGEDGHDVLQLRPFRVPDDTNRHDFRSVHQRPADLNFGAAGRRAVADVAHSAGLAQQLTEQLRRWRPLRRLLRLERLVHLGRLRRQGRG